MMELRTFLQHILPEPGVKYLVVQRNGRNGMAHLPFSSIEEMAETAKKLDADPNITVYHACSAYREPAVLKTLDDGSTKKQYRVQTNRLAAKSLWCDLDVGEGKPYQTKQEAVASIASFCGGTKFPIPVVVDSGYGVHCYWPFTEPLAHDDWVRLATTFKSTLTHFGVHADPTRTADFASILRPVGSHNKKAEPRKVKLRTPLVAYAVSEITASLMTIVSNHNVPCEDVPAYALSSVATENDDLTGHLHVDIPSDPDVMADKCQQVRVMRETGGGNYEFWRRCIGVLKFCTDGANKVHEWSKQGSGYNKYETQQKLDTWNTGPSTCAAIEQCNPGGCDGCPFKGHIKTPLVLGRVEATEPVIEVTELVMEPNQPPVSTTIEYPKGFYYDNAAQVMIRNYADTKGMLQQAKFCKMKFYITSYIKKGNSTEEAIVRVFNRRNIATDFPLSCGLVAVGGSELMKELGNHGVIPSAECKDVPVHIAAYMRASLNELKRKADEISTMITLGWQDDSSFLLGPRLFVPSEAPRNVMLGGSVASADSMSKFPVPSVDHTGWTAGVNYIWGRPGMEPMQYTLCSGFGSVLSVFAGEYYSGIPLVLTGSVSGKGKTTVCHAALSAFGNASELSINGNKGSTANGFFQTLAVMRNTPILLDEVSQMKPAELSEILYQSSDGKGKVRLKMGKDGEAELVKRNRWRLSYFITSNTDLGAVLALGRKNTMPEAVRYVDIKTDDYEIPVLDVATVDVHTTNIAAASGAAGSVFLQYVVDHHAQVSQRVQKLVRSLAQLKDNEVSNVEYRFYRSHIACTYVAAEILVELGLVNFDLVQLWDWTLYHFNEMCKNVKLRHTISGEDAFNDMVTELSSGYLQTDFCHDSRGGNKLLEHVDRVPKEPIGRFIRGTMAGKDPFAGRLYLSKKEVRKWCTSNNVPENTVLAFAKAEGLFIPQSDDRFVLGRGTDVLTGQVRCYCFDMSKANALGLGLTLVAQGTQIETEAA